MTASPFQQADEAIAALRVIVAERGPETLSQPSALSSLLAGLLPDAPRITRILVAAAEDHIADALREHISQGMDVGTAARLTASAFEAATLFAPEACAWAVGALGAALGLIDRPPTIVISPDHESPVPLAVPPIPAARRVAAAAEAVVNRFGATLYVANSFDGTVTPVDVLTMTARDPIMVGALPMAIVITPDGARAYVANFGDGTVTPISLLTNLPDWPIKVGKGPVSMVVTADGATVFVADGGDGSDGTITPIDTATQTARAPINVAPSPMSIVITPDGTTAYVASSYAVTRSISPQGPLAPRSR